MTRKHFQMIADILANPRLDPEVRSELVSEFVRMLSGLNPRFDSARFKEACQPA